MRVRSLRTLDELDAVRAFWERSQHHANSDLEQFRLVCSLRQEVERPLVTVVEEDDGTPIALLAGRLEHQAFEPTIGYLRLARWPATILAVIHHGALGRLDGATAAAAVEHLRRLLRDGVADAVQFHWLDERSPLLQALRSAPSLRLCDRTPCWSTHRGMTLDHGRPFVETRLRAKHRSSLRKRQKDLDAAFPGAVRWRWLTGFDDIPGLCESLERVAARTYQRGLGAGFFDGDEYRRRFELFAARGQLRVQLLEIGGSVRAFWFGTVYDGVFHSSETGYDPELAEFEVGTLMFIRMIEALIEEGVGSVDFGLGDAFYKERFGDHSWRETPVWLFAPTAKGAAMMLMLKGSRLIDASARRLVERAGLTDRIKALWRRRRSRRATAAAPAAEPAAHGPCEQAGAGR